MYVYRNLFLIALVSASLSCIGQTTDTTAVDSTLLRQITEQMNNQPPATPARGGLNFNPDIGVIGDFRGEYISVGNRNLDAYLKETEISLQSVVDPYVRADFFVSLSRNPQTREYGAEVEEGYLTTLSLPARLQLRA